MLDAGLRAGEVCALQWRSINLPRLRLDVIATWSRAGAVTSPKSGKSRAVPITRRLAAALEAIRGGDPAWVYPAAAARAPQYANEAPGDRTGELPQRRRRTCNLWRHVPDILTRDMTHRQGAADPMIPPKFHTDLRFMVASTNPTK